ncbi:hypothetical protein Micbo1qcDRAFT_172746 [Microdochium bolleyi]|uniref:BZIP domain-containing protein n=1 Tax=Microdochium bolleyi TaxID=196109 RepID=A0A136J9U7_9PEZI|nr:hypothetical protein Micbo1qcDRAFT_172746 [Microdochium bolleyi]
MPLNPLISQLPVDWPPAIAHDLAQSPHATGLDLAAAMDDLDPEAQHQRQCHQLHQHQQHLHSAYLWDGLWLDANADSELSTAGDYARQLNLTDPVFSPHSVHQAPSYFELPMNENLHYAVAQSPAVGFDYGQGTNYMSSTHTMSSASTDTSATSPIEKKPRTQRERNRLAAHKCRQKSKVNAEELQRQERELAEQHRCLTQHVQFLRNEVLDLKNEILRHGTCDSQLISEYIARAAQSLP